MDASCSVPDFASGVALSRGVGRQGITAGGRLRAALAVVVLHGLVIWAIIQGLAGDGLPPDDAATLPALRVYNVVATPPQPPPKPAQRQPEAAKAPPAKRAQATAIVMPKHTAIVPPHVVTAPVASSGSAALSGAAAVGVGAGDSGSGSGGGIAQKAIKLSGDINSTRDYPPDPELRRLSSSVIVRLTVLTDGRVGDCRIQRPSVDPQADAATCRLAIQRFRFRPATDAAGKPVESVYGWKQSWFKPTGAGR